MQGLVKSYKRKLEKGKKVRKPRLRKDCPACGGRLIPQEGRLMKCPRCNFIEDRDFIAAVNLRMWGVWGSPERVGGFELSDEGPMKTNPYGIMAMEKQRIGLKFHEIAQISP